MADWRSLGPRIRHWLETGEGASAEQLVDHLGAVADELREIAMSDGSEEGDLIFEAFLILRTLEQGLSPDGDTTIQLSSRERPRSAKGGRPPLPIQTQWRYHAAAGKAEQYRREGLSKPAAIERALVDMRSEGRAQGLSEDGIDRKLSERRRERETQMKRRRVRR